MKYARRVKISSLLEFGYYFEGDSLTQGEVNKLFRRSGLKESVEKLVQMKLDEKIVKLIEEENERQGERKGA